LLGARNQSGDIKQSRCPVSVRLFDCLYVWGMGL